MSLELLAIVQYICALFLTVKDQREYRIAFIALKNEIHHFNFELDESFFSKFEDSLIKQCKLFIDLAFDKKDKLFILNFDISGTLRTECDRCGEQFDLPIHGNHNIYVKVGDLREEDEDNEEVIWIPDSESNLDLSDMIYEFAHLSIPIRKVHPDINGIEGCAPEIMSKILESKEKSDPDPRWDILNKLSNKLN